MIVRLTGREILDSRGRPTVEATVELSDGTRAAASVPSGASKGRHEAVELRDGDPGRYRGQGARAAANNINDVIGPALSGREPTDQAAVDSALIDLDGTPAKAKLGANATLAVSIAVARAAAVSTNVPLWRHLGGRDAGTLPLPMVNMISGGLHARGSLDVQDFLVLPLAARSWSEALAHCVEIHTSLGEVLAAHGFSTLRADEGGYGPPLRGNDEPFALLEEAVVRAGLTPGQDVGFGLDIAATHFYDHAAGVYRLRAENRSLDPSALVDMLAEWTERYPIVSIEDGLAEDDWAGWQKLFSRLGDRVQLVGDDLFTTNLARLERGIEQRCANAILVKMNQIGTLTETVTVARRAQQAGLRVVVSARSGETEDSALADLAVAVNAGQIKIGSVTQSERLAKYNRLSQIEDELAERGRYAGRDALRLPTPGIVYG